RAIRADKLTYAALSVTLLHYLKGEAEREIPIWRMVSATPDAIRTRAQGWANRLPAELVLSGDHTGSHAEVTGEVIVIPGESTIGGGSLPGETLPTFLLALNVRSPKRFLARLRAATPPVIARAQDKRVLLDPRTVLEEQDESLIEVLRQNFHIKNPNVRNPL
ncbi:MAG: hypothetical protein ACE5GO_09260, partial [Anaerolineales bacterium]